MLCGNFSKNRFIERKYLYMFKKLNTRFSLCVLSIFFMSTGAFAQITGNTHTASTLAKYSQKFVALTTEMNNVLSSLMEKQYIQPYSQDFKENTVSASFLGLSFSLDLHKNSERYPAFLLQEDVQDIANPKDEDKIIYTHSLRIDGQITLKAQSGVTVYTLDDGQSWFFKLSKEYVPYEKERQFYLISSALTAHLLEAQE